MEDRYYPNLDRKSGLGGWLLWISDRQLFDRTISDSKIECESISIVVPIWFEDR